jgi:hypothetical protein
MDHSREVFFCSMSPLGNHNSKKTNRIFFNLKNESVIQQVIIDTILLKYNCLLDDLAYLLGVGVKKLQQVRNGEDCLSEKKSQQLISLFYLSTS